MHLPSELPRPCGPRNDDCSGPSLRDGNAIEAIHEAAQSLASGNLVAFPTETVYGLGADGLNPAAVEKIFKAKGRPADHPVILHVADIAHARTLASHWPDAAQALAQEFWPGPLTLILKRASCVSDLVTGGQDTVGIRIPSHPAARALLNEFSRSGSGVIAAPSANCFGGVSPTRARDVLQGIGNRLGAHDIILDGGDCKVGIESSIVDLSGNMPQILRPGGVSRESIERVLGTVSLIRNKARSATPRVSGSLESHYAPRARAELLEMSALVQAANTYISQAPAAMVVALCIHEPQGLDERILVTRMPATAEAYATVLYATLNDLDEQGADLLLIECPEQSLDWEAVLDRLQRACA